MSALSLDIGTYSIKALAGKPGKKPEIERAIEVLNPLGYVVPQDDSGVEKMSEYVATLLHDHELPRKDLRVSLPETMVSTKIISIPPLNDAELASAIGWQAEQHIPIPLEELSLEYEVLYRPKKNAKEEHMRVLMIGVRKKVVEKFLNVFLNIGIEPKLLETQTAATLRALQFNSEDPTTLVVDMGANNMSTFVVEEGELKFVFASLSGGQLLTKTLEQSLGLDPNQAEEYKRAYGLDQSQFEGKIFAALQPSVNTLVGEMLKAIQFYTQKNPSKKIERVLLSGGGSQLKGLVEFVTQKAGVEVLVAAPFATASGNLPQTSQTSYTSSVGLLMRDI